MASDLISRASRKSLGKNPKGQCSESFWVGELVEVLGEWCVWRKGMDASRPFPYLALCVSSIWLLPNYFFYNLPSG